MSNSENQAPAPAPSATGEAQQNNGQTTNETVNPATPADSVSPEILDYVQSQDPGNPETLSEAQPDASHDTEEVKQSDPSTENTDESDQLIEEGKENDSSQDEQPKEEPKSKEPTTVFEVAGKQYKTYDDAVAAINKIAGDNARIYGENKRLKTFEQQFIEQKKLADEAIAANKAWAEYYEALERGENAEVPELAKKATIEQTVQQVLSEKERQKEEASTKERYQTELQELTREPDFATVIPVAEELSRKLGQNLTGVSPKELYQMARGIVSSQNGQGKANKIEEKPNEKTEEMPRTVTQALKKAEEKVIRREQAKKVVGGSDRRTSPTPQEPNISPELADYLGQYT